ncbi:hypothetical protein SynBIOSE41_02382 [Synechococcus sp. BIOS-E4-1]|nr:hypothetical protein SynBIOSE41_02382 [Synechococcus sp. BIOS-E4-1]
MSFQALSRFRAGHRVAGLLPGIVLPVTVFNDRTAPPAKTVWSVSCFLNHAVGGDALNF